jgi:hypothetical protein
MNQNGCMGEEMKTLHLGVARILKRLHYPLEVILTCVRWYVAYPLGLPTFFCEPGGTRVLPGVISKDRSSITAYPRR